METPVLYLVIPCYNEQEVLPITGKQFLKKMELLINKGLISPASRILFVNDGSHDETWDIIRNFVSEYDIFLGINLSRNRGHQNAVLAGLMESKKYCDITISLDCDGQDDLDAIEAMVQEYLNGYEVVYGARKRRDTDTFFKRSTAEVFYKLMSHMGVELIYNHADYRLISSDVLDSFEKFKEVNLFLRGMIPMVGYRSTVVYYDREKRIAGESHYPLRKMLELAFNGITSLSIKPIRLITGIGFFFAFFSFVGIIWSVLVRLSGRAIDGWASTICIVCLVGGLQLISMGVLGEYIGKTYLETKNRPRYIISERLGKVDDKVGKKSERLCKEFKHI